MKNNHGYKLITLFAVLFIASLAVFVSAQEVPSEDTDYELQTNPNTYKIDASADGYVSGSIPQFDATTQGSVIIQLFPFSAPTVTTVPNPNWGGTDPPGSEGAPGGSPGNGGGTGPIQTPQPKKADISVDKRSIAIGHVEGQKTRINEAIKIKNIGNVNVSLNLRLQGSDELSINPQKLALSVGQEKTVFVSGEITKLKVGAYPVKVSMASSDGKISKEVVITITVSPLAKLFDVVMQLSTGTKSIFAGDEIPLNITVTNIAGASFDDKIQYSLKDFSNKVIFTEESTISGSPEASVLKNIKTSVDLQSGNYMVEARIIDKGETVATAVLTVFINGKDAKTVADTGSPLLIIIIVVVIIVAISTLAYLKKDKLMSLFGRGGEGGEDLYEQK